MSWITAILQLYSQEADLFGNVIVKRINIRLFDLLARFHYILNLPRNSDWQMKHSPKGGFKFFLFFSKESSSSFKSFLSASVKSLFREAK